MALKGDKKREWQMEYNRKNRAKINAAQREWAKKNPEKSKLYQRKSDFKAHYGITIEQYDKMFDKQQGFCAICLRHQKLFSLRLAVDHSHKTGKIRGLLCSSCNTALGLIGEENQTLQRMVAYIMIHDKER